MFSRGFSEAQQCVWRKADIYSINFAGSPPKSYARNPFFLLSMRNSLQVTDTTFAGDDSTAVRRRQGGHARFRVCRPHVGPHDPSVGCAGSRRPDDWAPPQCRSCKRRRHDLGPRPHVLRAAATVSEARKLVSCKFLFEFFLRCSYLHIWHQVFITQCAKAADPGGAIGPENLRKLLFSPWFCTIWKTAFAI